MFPYSSMSPARLPRLSIGRGGTNIKGRGDTSNAARMLPVLRPVEAVRDDVEITGFGTAGNFVHVRDDSKDNVSAEEMAEPSRELSLEDDKASRDSPKAREFRLETALVDAGQPDSTGTSSRGGKHKLICQILGLAIPALASMSVDHLMSAVDTAYIGQLSPDLGGGKVGLGALGLNTTVFYFIFFIFDFLATVPTPLVASARAEGDFAKAANLVGQLLTLALMVGTFLTLLLEFYGSALLHLMGSTSLNESEALLFLRTRALAAPAVLLIVVGNGAYRGFLDTKTPLFIAVGAHLINFVLDPILIFKLRLGVRGAAIATVIAEWTGALVFLLLLGLKDPAIRPRMISLPETREGWEQGRAVVTSSVSAFCGTLSLMLVVTMAGALAARAGPASIAAHQVAMLLWLLFGFVGRSLAITAQGLIADRIGTDAPLEARRVASLTQLLGEGWGIALLVIFLVGRNVLPLIFTPDKEVLEALAPIFVVVGVMQPINSFVYVGEGILEGCKDFVYEAVTRALGAMLGAGYMIFCASFKTEITLLDAWIGLLILQGSRATTFSYRHWFDPLGPLVFQRYPEDLDEFDVEVIRE